MDTSRKPNKFGDLKNLLTFKIDSDRMVLKVRKLTTTTKDKENKIMKTNITKQAWLIRRSMADRQGVDVMAIPWKTAYRLAYKLANPVVKFTSSEDRLIYSDKKTRLFTRLLAGWNKTVSTPITIKLN
jgi:hypothetical protein